MNLTTVNECVDLCFLPHPLWWPFLCHPSLNGTASGLQGGTRRTPTLKRPGLATEGIVKLLSSKQNSEWQDLDVFIMRARK